MAQDSNSNSKHPTISDKTRAEYLGQLKGFLEYALSCGFITTELSRHIEMPNTKQSKAVERPPFTPDDLQKIFPKDYGVDFGKKSAVLASFNRVLLWRETGRNRATENR